jgi:hypothetical protein
MKFNGSYLSALLVISTLLSPVVLAQTSPAQTSPTIDLAEVVSPAPVAGSFSSSNEALDLSSPTSRAAASASGAAAADAETATKPFSALAVGVGIGVGGIGFDVATPLARKFNLRGTGDFFRYNATITENSVTYGGDIQLASGGAVLDWFPFGGAFRLSVGVTAYNGNQLTGTASLNPNQSFTINGNTYYSSATDPAHASATLQLGTRAAPSFSFGWGNMVPRKVGKHFSFPVAIGFVYVGQPKVDLVFGGSTCNSVGTACQSIANNPTFQSDLAAQKAKYQNDLSALRFYPILSFGIGYKF